MPDSFIPDTRFAQVCLGIISQAQERLALDDLFESNVQPTRRRAQTFSRLLSQYEKSRRIVLDHRAIAELLEAYGMSEHNLQIVEGEVLATRLGWDDTRIEQLRLTQAVLKPIVDHIYSARARSSSTSGARLPDRADDPAAVQVLRDILTVAESAYEPEDWDGRVWADAIDNRGAYRPDALDALSDPMAESIIGVIRDGFSVWHDNQPNSFEFSNEHFLEIMKELETDRDRLTRIMSVLEDERTKLQKPSPGL
jgi:hypothetical protein